MIRRAGLADVPMVARMAIMAHVEAGEAGEPSIFAAQEVAIYAIERGAVFLSPRGCLAAHVVSSPIAPDWRIACELFWRVEPKATVEMLRAFTAWWKSGVADDGRVSSASDRRPAVERRMRMEGYRYRGASYGWGL